MNAAHWTDYTNAELRQAEEARRAGNEGRARVCARRAAGYIIREYLRLEGTPMAGGSAYVQIQSLANQEELPPRIREILNHLMMRLTPEHILPVDADLIAEVRELALELLGEDLSK